MTVVTSKGAATAAAKGAAAKAGKAAVPPKAGKAAVPPKAARAKPAGAAKAKPAGAAKTKGGTAPAEEIDDAGAADDEDDDDDAEEDDDDNSEDRTDEENDDMEDGDQSGGSSEDDDDSFLDAMGSKVDLPKEVRRVLRKERFNKATLLATSAMELRELGIPFGDAKKIEAYLKPKGEYLALSPLPGVTALRLIFMVGTRRVHITGFRRLPQTFRKDITMAFRQFVSIDDTYVAQCKGAAAGAESPVQAFASAVKVILAGTDIQFDAYSYCRHSLKCRRAYSKD